MKLSFGKICFATVLWMGVVSPGWTKETPVGKPQSIAGMEIGAVYLQPIEMEPAGMMRDAKDFGCPS